MRAAGQGRRGEGGATLTGRRCARRGAGLRGGSVDLRGTRARGRHGEQGGTRAAATHHLERVRLRELFVDELAQADEQQQLDDTQLTQHSVEGGEGEARDCELEAAERRQRPLLI